MKNAVAKTGVHQTINLTIMSRSYIIPFISAVLFLQCSWNFCVAMDHMSFLLGLVQCNDVEELRSLQRFKHITHIQPGREVSIVLQGGIFNQKLGGSNGIIKFKISETGCPMLPLKVSDSVKHFL